MNRLEAIKAMLDGKKVGHHRLTPYEYYSLEERRDPIRLKQEYDQTDSSGEMSYDDGYYIIKNKVKKYKVLYIGIEDLDMKHPYLMISSAFYKGIDDFKGVHDNLIPLQLLETTMIEVEE